ncbi:MAG TPA: type IX secretion system sortase PorU, partial [Draconibacterium sp.]|nr:type IX secretion system sortase PorU [Draconibacterium sp.]
MKKYFFLLFIIVVGFTGGDVQKELIVLNWNDVKITENGISVFNELNFENAEFPYSETHIPFFYQIYNLININQDFNFSIENAIFEEIKLSVNFPGYSSVEDDIQIVTNKYQSNGVFKLHLQISAVKREGNKILRLKEFQLKQIPISESKKLKSGKNIKSDHVWKTSSVLKQGKWVKIAVAGKGVIKIPHSKLISLGFADPTKVNVYGSGGTILSEDPGVINYDDLEQCAVWHDKNNGADCLFLYSPGTTEWSLDWSKGIYKHTLNDYATKGYFFLTDNVGSVKITEKLPVVEEPATHPVSVADAYVLYENELENVLPLGSGKQWFGEKFRHSSVKNIDFNLEDVDPVEPIKVRINGIARSYARSELKVQVNQTEIGILNFNQVNTGSQTGSYANEQEGTFSSNVQGNQAKVTLKYFGNNDGGVDDNAICWLDFIEINYRRKLKFGNEPLFFRDRTTVGAGNTISFTLENGGSNSRIFDVTHLNNVKEVPVQISGSLVTAKRPGNELAEYLAFNPNGNYSEPEYLGEVGNQNLHALGTPEFIIISHSNFIGSANKLADFHRTYDGMRVEVVTAEQVYNEFSSGTKSATGIRNFVKMFYDRGEGLKYVLLFGDGSFDNRSLRPETKNFIPTFQSQNSLVPVASFVTDDYFVMLDAGESVYNGAVDLGVGRIPSTTNFEAELVINKIQNYYNPEALGNWRNIVCLIGDDKDGSLHMSDSEKLANQINKGYGEFITEKIYFD